MGKHTLLKLLLFSLILFHCSDAFFIRDFRNLIDSTTKDSPIPKEKQLDPKNTVDANVPPVSPPQSLPKVEKNNNGDNQNGTSKNDTNTPPPVTETAPPPPVTEIAPPPPVPETAPPPPVPETAPPPPVPANAPPPVPKKAEEDVKGKSEGIKLAHSTTNDSCVGLNFCTDDGVLVACISNMDSKHFVVLLQNRGDGTVKVKLRSDYESNLGDVEVDKNKTEKVTIKRIRSESTELTLDAGKGDCVLHAATLVPEQSFFLRLPSYDKILTPVNGAYFLIFTLLVFGGIWGCCCMFRKKRHDEVQYQELEMALPESVSATNVESAEGWDQVWDDDWDDNAAVISPAVRHAGSISANGLTSRSLNKDGWEDNWDD
ncbi:unnamed protein product [Trifolium pratense]|uniref:Uncharacterized protein n=1 Tax=Trifolium pratense TaxID=57577 RepID=A0ACB0LRD9_TRIPR|nr:unnamed protein product [Trifolium pratense]